MDQEQIEVEIEVEVREILIEPADTPVEGRSYETEQEEEEDVDTLFYLLVFIGDAAAADKVVARMDEKFFAPMTYVGSATVDHDEDVEEPDRYDILIGVKGGGGQLDGIMENVIDFVRQQTELDATIRPLVVDRLLVDRPSDG